jgi:hypothetical protein
VSAINNNNQMKTIVALLQGLLFAAMLTGCVSVARVSDFKRTADGLDFDALARRDYDSKDAVWNQKTGYEYFIEEAKIDDDDLVKGITTALESLNFKLQYSSKQDRTIIAERGLRANEWSSVVGVYYRPKDAIVQIYVRNEITQDFTGGWRDNRAKDVAQAISTELKMGARIQKKP